MLFITTIEFDINRGEYVLNVFDTADNTEQDITIDDYTDLCVRNVSIFPRLSKEYIRDLRYLNLRYKEKHNLTKRSEENIEGMLPMKIMDIILVDNELCLASLCWVKLKYQVQNIDSSEEFIKASNFADDRYHEYTIVYYKNKLIFTSDVDNMLNVVYHIQNKIILYGYTTDATKKVYVYGLEIDRTTATVTDIYKGAYAQTTPLPATSIELHREVEVIDDNWVSLKHPYTYSSEGSYFGDNRRDIQRKVVPLATSQVEHIITSPRLNKVFYMFKDKYIIADNNTREQIEKPYAFVHNVIVLKKPKYDKILRQECNKALQELLDVDYMLIYKSGWNKPIEVEHNNMFKYSANVMGIILPYLNYKLKDLLTQMAEDIGLLELFVYFDMTDNIGLEYLDIRTLRLQPTKPKRERPDILKGISTLKGTWLTTSR